MYKMQIHGIIHGTFSVNNFRSTISIEFFVSRRLARKKKKKKDFTIELQQTLSRIMIQLTSLYRVRCVLYSQRDYELIVLSRDNMLNQTVIADTDVTISNKPRYDRHTHTPPTPIYPRRTAHPSRILLIDRYGDLGR